MKSHACGLESRDFCEAERRNPSGPNVQIGLRAQELMTFQRGGK